jgi:hypothetical protein
VPGNQDDRLFDRLLAEGECEWIEFKDSWFDPGGIGRYASALANSARLSDCSAGYLLWGVNDSGDVVGTKLNPRTQVVQRTPFEFWLKGRLTPKGHPISFATDERDGKRLVVMTTKAAETELMTSPAACSPHARATVRALGWRLAAVGRAELSEAREGRAHRRSRGCTEREGRLAWRKCEAHDIVFPVGGFHPTP